ncbi:hypothetical protein [Enterococcus casseliflavus]|uniref:hypothetical protein n=1 Tax=Enterococcus casseliflavus TaxID=37734 RepID=UPI00301954BD
MKPKTMPKSFENKLRKLNRLVLETANLDKEIQEFLDTNKIPYDNLVANVGAFSKEPVTEALAYINNAECKTKESLDESIEQIRKVYEYFINLSEEEREEFL